MGSFETFLLHPVYLFIDSYTHTILSKVTLNVLSDFIVNLKHSLINCSTDSFDLISLCFPNTVNHHFLLFFRRNFKITSLNSSQKIPLGSICIGTALYLGVRSSQAGTQHCFYSDFLYLRKVVDLLIKVIYTFFNVVLRYFILCRFMNQIFSFIFSRWIYLVCKIATDLFSFHFVSLWFKLFWQLFVRFSWVF